jgi:hypothetical protein
MIDGRSAGAFAQRHPGGDIDPNVLLPAVHIAGPSTEFVKLNGKSSCKDLSASIRD